MTGEVEDGLGERWDLASEPKLGALVVFRGARAPARIAHHGRRVSLRPLDPERDALTLYELSHAPTGDPTVWTYLPTGPYPDLGSYRASLDQQAADKDTVFFVITRSAEDRPLGVMCYMSIVPEHGRIEIGHIWFSAELKRSPEATEAIYLAARHAFDDLGFRRLEWKCNDLNGASRRAAIRFGFQFEGIFHNHQVLKGRNRDTAWFAITDERWPAVRRAFEKWLAPGNFNEDGAQLLSLRDLTVNGQADSTVG